MRRMVMVLLALWCGLAGSVGWVGAVGAVGGAPIGALDGVAARFGIPESPGHGWVQEVSGWAADPDAPAQPIDVHLYVDGHIFRVITTGYGRPDVGHALPWAGATTGWHELISSSDVGPGSHVVCAYAINVGAGSGNPLLGCHALPVTGPSPNNPVGHLDLAAAGPGLIRLRGWAGDPDGDTHTALRVYYDDGNTPMLDALTTVARHDVQAAFPNLGATTGFNLVLPALPGNHTICVYAQNTGAGFDNTTIGCARRAVPNAKPAGPHDPVGHIDRAYVHECNSVVCNFFGSGWGYDPDTAGPITIRLRAFSYFEGGSQQYIARLGNVTTGEPRPDVETLIPAAGPSSGFDGYLINGRFGSPPFVCAYALNSGPGSDRFLGCTTNVDPTVH